MRFPFNWGFCLLAIAGLSAMACTSNRPVPICRDGVIQAGEDCEGTDLAGQDCVGLGLPAGSLACTDQCTYDTSGCTGADPVCGDGVVDSNEGCDDFGVVDGDGCSAGCAVEAGWICSGQPSVCVRDCADSDGDLYGVGTGCLGTDCDDSDANIYPGAAERCNGLDDDCDQATDEQADQACYGGPAGTEGVGRCQAGTAYCVAGSSGPCVGQILPGAEACNGFDDDCDDQTDEGSATLACGIGECAASTPACVNGTPAQCIPGIPGSEQGNCSDGLDNDCNGIVDDCNCVHVAPFGNDLTGDGSEGSPLRTIQAGTTRATMQGQPKKVCVAGAQGCGSNNNWTFYPEDLTMIVGISVFGGYDPGTSPWTQRLVNPQTTQNPPPPRCVTEIQGQTQGLPAVLFDPSIVSPTALDNFAVSHPNPGQTSVVVTIVGSLGAQVSRSAVYGASSGSITVGIQISDDPITGAPATPILFQTTVEGGAGTFSVGIHSLHSAPSILAACSPANINADNRCLYGCSNGIHIRANRFFGNQQPDVGYGILLEDSPGAIVDQSVVCGSALTEVAAIKITGNASGTVISRSDIGCWGALFDNGIWQEDCAGASPWIGDNQRISAEGNQAGTATAAAVRSTGDCHPLIEANQLIVGGVEGQVQNTRGVVCERSSVTGVSSQCSIVNNVEIRGCNNNFPTSSIGVLCKDGSCNVISGNQLIHGRSGINAIGLQLDGATNAFVDKNRIAGGCGTSASIGILAQNGAGRIQNNSIHAGTCQGGLAGNQFLGVFSLLAAGVNELDLHSNYIHGGGNPQTNCASRGVAFDLLNGAQPPAGPLGIVRNNIIEAGDCNTRFAIEERDQTADPRIVENNDLLWANLATALYLDERSTHLMSAAEVDALTGTSASGNLDLDPLLTGLPNGFVRLDPASPCRNAGSPVGAPGWDFEDDLRPQEQLPDIGPDEYRP